jgi:hypothetical protein
MHTFEKMPTFLIITKKYAILGIFFYLQSGENSVEFGVPDNIMRIYPNLQAARDAIAALNLAISELMTNAGATLECDDSCCATYFQVQYMDENGKIRTFSGW